MNSKIVGSPIIAERGAKHTGGQLKWLALAKADNIVVE